MARAKTRVNALMVRAKTRVSALMAQCGLQLRSATTTLFRKD
jgi:hypothetical protein